MGRLYKKYANKNKLTIAIYVILRLLVIMCMIIQFIEKNYNNVFLCILTLILFLIPDIVDRKFNIHLPSALEIVIILFIFSAEILGEINAYYISIQYWDTMLHTINGFLMSAIGFAMIDILNRSPKFHFRVSPIFVALVAFCFSMTIGVVWEFFEFSMDYFTLTDMQKDFIVDTVSTISLNTENINVPIIISDIQNTTIRGVVDGKMVDTVIDGGYIDIGLIDTMKDLIVNCIGAIVFSIIGVFYIKGRGKGKIAKSFIPEMKED